MVEEVHGARPRSAARPELTGTTRAGRKRRDRAAQILWFCLIAFFWSGYLVLEGFDFGVGMLLPFVPVGSAGIALVWGIGLSNLLHGLPIDSSGTYTGNLWDLFTGYTVLGGIAFVLLFAFHGATFLTLRTTGDLCARSRCAARLPAILAVPSVLPERAHPGLRRSGEART